MQLYELVANNRFPQEVVLEPDEWKAMMVSLVEHGAIGWTLERRPAGNRHLYVGVLCDPECQPRVTPYAMIALVLTSGESLPPATMVKQVQAHGGALMVAA